MSMKNIRKHSKETKRKMSEKAKKRTGVNGSNWQGGKSFELYSIDWTETLRRSTRKRDNYTCQLCSVQQGDKAFDVHHIDYNKLNCNPNNLVTLCRSCHTITNGKRKFWNKYFKGRKTS